MDAVKKKENMNVKEMVLTGVFAAIFCILAPISLPIPISPVPISLTNLVLYFALYILGMRRGCISYLVYLLIGFVGLPVFSGFTGGAGKLLGPTGGYLFGFVFLALLSGFFLERYPERAVICFLAMVAGTAVCYVFGSLWLSYQAKMPLAGAFAAGVIPFIPGDLCKILIALLLGPQLKKRLVRAHLA